MINRLLEPSAGKITVNGKEITSVPPEILRRHIGYVLQHTGLFPHYTIAENMATVPKLLKWDNNRIRARTLELLEKLHLSPDYLMLYPSQLSGGQQQRVGLARALMADPPVLLLDEPFGALDPITRSGIRQEFKNLDELKRKTIIMVTHDVPEAFELGNQICLMDQGHIKQIGTPAELLLNPRDEFVSSFVKEQRLQLLLKATKLADTGKFKIRNLPAELNLWEALSLLLQPEGSDQLIYREDEITGEMREANLHDLLLVLPALGKN
jgi:osmoprotectant transport system ATP-binding protein